MCYYMCLCKKDTYFRVKTVIGLFIYKTFQKSDIDEFSIDLGLITLKYLRFTIQKRKNR